MQPKGLGSRDSFSTCVPTDIYVIIRNPQMKLNPIDPVELDTIEKECARNDAELKQMSGAKPILFLIKGTKIFLTVLFFPVRFVFAIPKFALTQILPQMSKKVKKAFSTLNNALRKLVEAVTIRTKVLKSLKVALHPLASLIKTSFQKLSQNIFKPFIAFLNGSKNGVNKMASFVSKQLNKIKGSFSFVKTFTSKVMELSKKAEDILPSSIPFASSFTKLNAASKSFANSVNSKAKSLGNKVAHYSKGLQKGFARLVKPVATKLKAISKKTAAVLDNLKKKVVNAIAPKVVAISEAIENKVVSAIQLCKPPVVIVVAFLSQINQSALQLLFRNPGVQILKSRFAALKKMTAKVQRVSVAILKAFERVKDEAKKTLKQIASQAKKLYTKAAHYGEKGRQKAMLVVGKFLNLIKTGLIYFMSFFTGLGRFFVGLVRWFRIMVRFSGYLVREIYREFKLQLASS